MNGRIDIVTTDDKYILHGMVCRPTQPQPATTWVIHVHGSYGNFYENFFLGPMADAYTKAGIAFVSVNTRGRDYYADFKTREEGKYSSRRIGGIREVFSECIHDIRPWIQYARENRASRIVLQGHSLGAMKVAYYAWKEPANVTALILLSPPDSMGLQKADVSVKYDEYLALARDLTATKPDELMPGPAYYDPITCSAYCGLFEHPEDTGMFTYGDIDLMRRSALGHVACPILATFATQGEAIAHDVAVCKKALASTVQKSEQLDVEIVEGANHSYHFREEVLAAILAKWVLSRVHG